jgi:hypothetical protein
MADLERLAAIIEWMRAEVKPHFEKIIAFQERVLTRMDVFEEKLVKMNATGKACLGKTEANIETGQEPREVESRTDLEEVDTTDLELNPEGTEAVAERQKRPQWKLSERRRTDMGIGI